MNKSIFSLRFAKHDTVPVHGRLTLDEFLTYNYNGDPPCKIGSTGDSLLYISDGYLINGDYIFTRIDPSNIQKTIRKIIDTAESQWR